MTDGPLKSNSTMCCRGQERRGSGDPLLLLLPSVRLVWLLLRAAAEAAELLLPFASCVYFSLLRVPEWVERSWRRCTLPPSGIQRPAGTQASSSSTISSGSAWFTHSGHFPQTCNLLLGFFFSLWIFAFCCCSVRSSLV